MPDLPVRYTSDVDDNTRWLAFPFRPGDIVISTRSKHGTTWMQMICALLVFRTPTLPRPLHELSPWLDWLGEPVDDLFARLASQQHRRFIKTHTPLDGIPIDPRVTYLVVARDPLDARVSLYHQSANLDREHISKLTGEPAPTEVDQPPLRQYLLDWVEHDADPREALESLPGVIWHIKDASRRQRHENVILVHYDDLLLDLDGSMRRLARQLGTEVDEQPWPALVDAARFEQMSAAPADHAPDPGGVLKDVSAFFRRGRSGAGAEVLSEPELARYRERVRALADADLAAWLLRDEPTANDHPRRS